jgi:hypothetical protein
MTTKSALQQAADQAATKAAYQTPVTASEVSGHLVPATPPAKPAQQSAAEKAWALLDEFINILPTQFIGRYEKLVTEHLGKRG